MTESVCTTCEKPVGDVLTSSLHDRCLDKPQRRKWLAWCTSDYTMKFCREKAAELRKEGYIVRVDHKGRDLAGDGTYQTFGKIFIEIDRATGEAIKF